MSEEIGIQGIRVQKVIANMLVSELSNFITLLEDSEISAKEQLSKTLTALHRLKGSSGFMGLQTIENGAREFERSVKEASSVHVENKEQFLNTLKSLLEEINVALS